MEATQKSDIERLVAGSQLIVNRSLYRHHGIYAGNGQVIHYAGWFRSRCGLVEQVSLTLERGA